MSKPEIISAKPIYIKLTADLVAAQRLHPDRLIIWHDSFGHSPGSERYDMDFKDPEFNEEKPFEFGTHPFWDV